MEKTNLDASKSCCVNNEIEYEGFFVCNKCGRCKPDLVMTSLHSELNGFKPLCSIINDISENIDIPYQTRYTVQDQYLRWKKKYPTMNSRVLKATAIYFSCKKQGVPRTLREISSASGVCPKKIGKYDAVLTNSYSEVSAEMYINRFCFKIGKDFQFVKRAIKQLDKMSFKNGFNPVTLAVSAIYLTSLEEPLADKEILKKIRLVSGVSAPTLACVVKTIKS